ncbi:MAG: hypothetical protein Tsb0014_13070 [Pleurocapsa sp.]
MWRSQIEILKTNSIHKITLFSDNQPLTYGEVIDSWDSDGEFRSFFNYLLADSPFSAYFWETPPITLSTVERDFEFVLIDSPQLARVQPNLNSFQEYFQFAPPEQKIITFPNLGNDALLVVPSPRGEISAYPHLAAFVRQASPSQQDELWQILGKVIKQQLNKQPIWISTSGLGIYWLHIRLDSFPKYYNFRPYRSY